MARRRHRRIGRQRRWPATCRRHRRTVPDFAGACIVRRLSAADATAFGLLDGSDISGATCEPFEDYLERRFGRDPAS
ncbi:MAG: hypothetical protein SFV23_02220 [Planctomycetaceae bacterium]|nr:hypothetical protein [Planctomycetaceae bacterium]